MRASAQADRFLTLSEASRWLAARKLAPASRNSLESAIAKRRLRSHRPADRVLLVKPSDLERYATQFCRSSGPTNADAA